jgi:hypothetical protein
VQDKQLLGQLNSPPQQHATCYYAVKRMPVPTSALLVASAQVVLGLAHAQPQPCCVFGRGKSGTKAMGFGKAAAESSDGCNSKRESSNSSSKATSSSAAGVSRHSSFHESLVALVHGRPAFWQC